MIVKFKNWIIAQALKGLIKANKSGKIAAIIDDIVNKLIEKYGYAKNVKDDEKDV